MHLHPLGSTETHPESPSDILTLLEQVKNSVSKYLALRNLALSLGSNSDDSNTDSERGCITVMEEMCGDVAKEECGFVDEKICDAIPEEICDDDVPYNQSGNQTK